MSAEAFDEAAASKRGTFSSKQMAPGEFLRMRDHFTRRMNKLPLKMNSTEDVLRAIFSAASWMDLWGHKVSVESYGEPMQ